MKSNFKLIRKRLIHIIESSSISDSRKDYLIKSTRNLSDSSTFKLLFVLNEKMSSREVDKLMKIGLTVGIVGAMVATMPAAATGVMLMTPGSFEVTGLIINKMIESYNWKCGYKCKNLVLKNKKLCYKNCNSESLKIVETLIKSEFPKCNKIKAKKDYENPQKSVDKSLKLQSKCRNKLYDELLKIRQKRVKADLKLKQYLRTNK